MKLIVKVQEVFQKKQITLLARGFSSDQLLYNAQNFTFQARQNKIPLPRILGEHYNNPSSRALSPIRELNETRVYLLLDVKISKYSYYISTNNGRAPLLLHNGYTPLESRASKRYSAFNLLDYGTIGSRNPIWDGKRPIIKVSFRYIKTAS